MTYSIKKHMLFKDGHQVRYIPTPNRGGKIKPTGLVMHHTASGITPAGDISWLTDRSSSASSHLVIDRHGEITQLCPFNVKAWHAGRSRWKGRSNCNNFTIGIEVDNPGGLQKRGDGSYSGIGGPYSAEDVVEATSPQHGSFRYWLAFPEAQLSAVAGAAVAIWRAYQLEDLVGHYDISPGRKTDIGPHFPMQSLRGLCEGRNDVEPTIDSNGDEVDGYVRARSGLNVRKWPSPISKILDTLHNRQPVSITRSGSFTHEGVTAQWHLIETGNMQGWVHGDYIERV